MNSNKKWVSVLMAAVLLMAPVSAVQAKSPVPAVTIAQAGDADQTEGNDTESPQAVPDQPADGRKSATPPIEDKVKFRNLAAGLSYEWSEAPEASHPDDGHKLTDGKYAKLDMNDPAWVGHLRGKSREVVFDLGKEKSIGKISAHFFQDYPTNSILVPLTVSMYVSDDKANWGLLSHNATQLLWGEGPPRQETFVWDGSRDGIKGGNTDGKMAYARYVKVIFTMHQSQWEYIDEIEIMGTDGELSGAVKVPAEQPHFLAPGEATAGIRNLNLLYNGQYDNGLGDWKKERIIPNISYVNKNGEPTDWLFDGVLYLGLASPAGRDFGVGQTILEDWKWYLDKTFAAKGDMQQLNEATVEVGAKLNQPDHKVKVVLMIPNPGEDLKNFGDVDGDGVSESFNDSDVGKAKALDNRQKAVKWWLDQVRQRWQAEHYSNLELVGMYWLEEQISTSAAGPDLVKAVSGKVHDMNLKFFWIPHSLAYKSYMWKDVGFDTVAYQPNYFFGGMDVDRLEDAANNAKRYGMGIEVEFDDRMLTDGVFLERYIDYLNSGVSTGLMQKGFRAYYQGNNAVYNLGVSKDPDLRLMYDWLYQYLNGTYATNNSPAPETMSELVRGYVASKEIDSAFGSELSNRLQTIKLLLEQNKPKDAVANMKDFLAHIHDPAVQSQGLISAPAVTILDTYAQVLIHSWSDSSGLSNLVLGKNYTVSKPPNSNYPDSGNELTNGQFGGTDYGNKQWQGFAGSDYPDERSRTITFDLGSSKSIGLVRAHFLQDRGPGIYFPQSVTFSISSDGQSWSRLATVTPPPAQDAASAEFVSWSGIIDGVPGEAGADKVYARYVKVEFPVNVWVFLDEIEVLGIDVDKSKLRADIDQAKKLHDDTSVGSAPGQVSEAAQAKLVTAIAAAQTVYDRSAAKQDEVDTAVNALSDAVKEFRSAIVPPKPDTPTMTLTGKSTVAAGEEFTVTLGLDRVSGSVYAQDLSLQYDAAAMTYVGAESILPGVSIVDKMTTSEGKLRFIVASEGAAHGVRDKANVLKLTFRAKNVTAPITGTIAVSNALVADDQGAESSIRAASLTIQVTVVTPGNSGDVNGDGKVSIGDLAIAAANYGRTSQDPNWAAIKACDLNGDGKIDIADLAAIAKQIVK
ncbi:DUF4855 domain-containing protein [Paenibacillus terrigena]|uniref:DUF4855 domain-containing protein n=1 Tax=Paenibacillus terrigena TaxID=369333 RepID=UPI000360BF27|nr:DUF4855 domain-containing protein [Paenibacillus terrigena]